MQPKGNILCIVFRLVRFISIGAAFAALLSFILSLWLYILSYHFANGQHYSGCHFHSGNVKINALNIFVALVLRFIRDYNYTGRPSHYNCLHAKNVLSTVSDNDCAPANYVCWLWLCHLPSHLVRDIAYCMSALYSLSSLMAQAVMFRGTSKR